MFNTCKHKWEVVQTNYTPPQPAKIANSSEWFARSLTEGVTHIYQKCSKCGDIKSQDVLGHFTQEKS